MDLADIYRTRYPKAAGYIFFSQVHMEMFSRIDHIKGHKKGLNKLKKTEIVSINFLDYNGMKLEINYMKKTTP